MERNRGQVGLLILVVMGILVSLTLSVASRSLSDLVLSRQEKEQSEVFHVAEEGVESALNAIRQDSGIGGSGTFTGNVSSGSLATGEYSIDAFGGLDLFVREGEVAELNLAGAGSPLVTLYWTVRDNPQEDVTCSGEGSGNAPAALEVTEVVSQDDPVVRSYYNASNCDLSSQNNFSSSSDPGNSYRSSVTIDTTSSGATALRLRPLYNGATIAVSGVNLPSQLYLINSTASGGDAQKDIEVKRTYDSAASIFDFALFTAGTIVK